MTRSAGLSCTAQPAASQFTGLRLFQKTLYAGKTGEGCLRHESVSGCVSGYAVRGLNSKQLLIGSSSHMSAAGPFSSNRNYESSFYLAQLFR